MNKKKILFFLFFVGWHTCFSQASREIAQLSKAQTFEIKVEVRKRNGELRSRYGTGMIFNKEYLFTCRHIVAEDYFSKLECVKVYYNRTTTNNESARDSVFVDLNYKKTKTQNLIKNKLESNTEFTILKLKTDLPLVKYEIPLLPDVKDGSMLYAYGMKGIFLPGKEIISSMFVASKVLHMVRGIDGDRPQTIAALGGVSHGFSGSPLYNAKGHVVGIIYGGADFLKDEVLKKMVKMGEISQQQYQEILVAYKNNQRIFFSSEASCLYENYIAKYIN